MTTTTAIDLEPVIGLEVHAQLLTQSKMFCGCSSDYNGSEPNTRVCPICLGMPGTLPVINRKAVEYTVMMALALNCEIPEHTKFDRKNYPYPDLMKGYQISQFDMPLSRNGWIEIEPETGRRRVGITRVHLEEDTARLTHRLDFSGDNYSLIDINRSGVPLMEIVGEPDLRSPEEARLYLVKLRSIMQYLGVSTGNMEEGSFRCDANISMRKPGGPLPTSKVEVKNMNSFRAVFRALEFEIQRQTQLIHEGTRITQETRGWVEERGGTVSQRSKEHAHDYRYFPEPDLPPLTLSRQWVSGLRARLPELPEARRDRFAREYALPLYDAGILTASKATADYFERAVKASPRSDDGLKVRAKVVANWTIGDLAGLLNAQNKEIEQSPVSPADLAQLLDLMDEGSISVRMAKEVFEEMFKSGRTPKEIVKERGMAQISDEGALRAVVQQVLAANPQAVADYRKGKQSAVTFLVGQVMKATRGQANPKLANQTVSEALAALPAAE